MTQTKTQLVGIINLTPDSFSDGGLYGDVERALAHAEKLLDDGAGVLDIGAESTRPNATAILHEEEWRRLEPFLEAISKLKNHNHFQLSIDTRHPRTAAKALSYDIDWINDVSGLANLDMAGVIADSDVKYVLMHSLTIPADPAVTLADDHDPVEDILLWVQEEISLLEKNGINRDKIIFDPGIGFGKNAEQSIALLKEIDRFRGLDIPLMVGHSRKSFLNKFTDNPAENRDMETALCSMFLAGKNVEYLRVHDISINKKAVAMAEILYK